MAQSVRPSVRLSVCLWHLFHYVPIIISSRNFLGLLPMTEVMFMQKVKVRGQRSRSQPNLTISGPQLQFEFTNDDEMMHKAWCCLGEVPYCFSRSSFKLQGHTAKKIVEFDPDWAFPDCNSSLNSPNGCEIMHNAESSIEEVPYCFSGSSIKFQGHTGWKIYDLNPIWVRLLGRSQLSNPSDLPC